MLNQESIAGFIRNLLTGISHSFFFLSQIHNLSNGLTTKENLNSDWVAIRNDFNQALKKFKVKQDATKKKELQTKVR